MHFLIYKIIYTINDFVIQCFLYFWIKSAAAVEFCQVSVYYWDWDVKRMKKIHLKYHFKKSNQVKEVALYCHWIVFQSNVWFTRKKRVNKQVNWSVSNIHSFIYHLMTMLFFQLIFIIISFIPLTNTILDDDILYDIQWQPELTTVCFSKSNLSMNYWTIFSQLNWKIILFLYQNEKKNIPVHYRLLKQQWL